MDVFLIGFFIFVSLTLISVEVKAVKQKKQQDFVKKTLQNVIELKERKAELIARKEQIKPCMDKISATIKSNSKISS